MFANDKIQQTNHKADALLSNSTQSHAVHTTTLHARALPFLRSCAARCSLRVRGSKCVCACVRVCALFAVVSYKQTMIVEQENAHTCTISKPRARPFAERVRWCTYMLSVCIIFSGRSVSTTTVVFKGEPIDRAVWMLQLESRNPALSAPSRFVRRRAPYTIL